MPEDKRPKLADFGDLSIAEQKIVDEIHIGDFVSVDTGERPDARTDDNHVRAELIRFLALGGGDDLFVHEKGVCIGGAWIDGVLDLDGCRLSSDLCLHGCHFVAAPDLLGARCTSLSFNGSDLPGLQAGRLRTEGSLHIRDAEIEGECHLNSARIGGNLELDGAELRNPEGMALAGSGLTVRDALFLRHAEIEGECHLNGARIGGTLELVGTKLRNPEGMAVAGSGLTVGDDIFLRNSEIEGECFLIGARIGGNLEFLGSELRNPNGRALFGDSMQVEGNMFLRAGASIHGVADLTGARIGHIADEMSCWPEEVCLNRCRYGAFTGKDIDARSRLDWLELQQPEKYGREFWPQPYEHLAKVFREMGHKEDARDVLVEKERLQRAVRRRNLGWPECRWFGFWDRVLSCTIAYGVRPMRAIYWLALFFLVGWGVFYAASLHDQIKPNNAFIIRSAEWVACEHPLNVEYLDAKLAAGRPQYGRASAGESQVDCFLRQAEGRSYPGFNAFIYSADTLLPVVSLEMQEYWLPDEAAGNIGHAARIYLWIHIAVGWALSLLAVAGFSGLVRSSD